MAPTTSFNVTEQRIINKAYANGYSVKVMADLLCCKASTISSWHSRQKAAEGLPPKVIINRTKIGGYIGRAIKKVSTFCFIISIIL